MHRLFDSNRLTGGIPETIGVVDTLEALRLDRNQLTGAVPSNLNNLSKLAELCHSLTCHPFWLQSVGVLEGFRANTDISFRLSPDAEGVNYDSSCVAENLVWGRRLRSNLINGTLDLGSQYSKQLTLVDVQDNRIQELYPGGYSNELL
ncbi:hypothetical protein B296_00026944 [Ensete ventricosum]|uniref:Leucine-rich repeat-containing N-terminal plant-type domain-containing protein n=1 Tax=Ensete ventricosum TaxID=4639 RepID=A0A426YFY1_ENSVE|nr:hypothetical protein B296_00026944 [Ensete ventricosum]